MACTLIFVRLLNRQSSPVRLSSCQVHRIPGCHKTDSFPRVTLHHRKGHEKGREFQQSFQKKCPLRTFISRYFHMILVAGQFLSLVCFKDYGPGVTFFL